MATWKEKYNKKYQYKKNKSHNLSDISKDTGVSRSGLQKIYNKGIGAYKTNPQSVRPNVTSKEQWAMARVYSSVMGGKASKVDAKELKMQMGGVIQNPNFKKWFRDSKVVDENGNPLVVYHGTSNDFKVFDKDKIGSNYLYSGEKSFFFTQKERTAKNYAKLHSNKNINGNNKGYVISSYLKIENPLYRQTNSDFYRPEDRFDIDGDDLIREAFENGNDGIIIKGTNNDDLYVVFEPNQIKSATDNDGQYSLKNDNITMQMGGETDFNPDGKIKDKIVHASGDAGGMLVGKRHSNGGIKALNKSTGQPLEMEGGEVVITRNAVSDNKKRSFNGKMMTNRQILSSINESGGGVSFADGGQVPNDVKFDCNAEYEYGGKTMCGKDLAYAMGGSLANKQLITKVVLTDFDKKGYFGQYKKVFDAFNKEYSLGFVDGAYELDSSGQRDSNGNYILLVSEDISGNVEDRLSKIKGISYKEIYIDKNMFQMGGTIECGSCSWSWDRKDGGDDMYVCHKCGADNSESYAKGGAIDDDVSELMMAVNQLNSQYEDGGLVDNIKSLEDILPLESGKGKDKIMLSLSGGGDNPKDLYIQFGRSSAQKLDTKRVADSLFNQEKKQIQKVIIQGNSYRTRDLPSKTVESLEELINYFQEITVDSSWKFQFYTSDSSDPVVAFELVGRVRKPTGWKAGYYFGQKDIKKDISNFLNIVYNQVSTSINIVDFVLGISDASIQRKEQFSKDEAERKANEKLERDYQKVYDSFVAKKVTVSNDITGNIVDELKKQELQLTKLLSSFTGIKNSVFRAKILKRLNEIEDKLKQDAEIDANFMFNSLESNTLFSPYGLLEYYYNQTTQSPTADLEEPCGKPTPNYNSSLLPYGAYLNVRTPQFKNWFGDWESSYDSDNYIGCSLMIDEYTKEPKVFYHGVRKYIKGFGQMSNMGQGIIRPFGTFDPPDFSASYFSDSLEYAKFYGGSAKNQKKPSDDYEPFIYKVFLDIKKPIDITELDFEISYKTLRQYLLIKYGVSIEYNNELLSKIKSIDKKHPQWIYIRNDIGFIETLKSYGFDGIIQTGDIPKLDKSGNPVSDRSDWFKEKEYLTFYPNQVKSVTAKKSFYANYFDDIRFKKGGYVHI